MAKRNETSSNMNDLTTYLNARAARKAAAQEAMHISNIAAFIFTLLIIAAITGAAFMNGSVPDFWIAVYVIGLGLIATVVLFGLKVARQWEKAVVLRLGRFHALRGPGMFWILPIIDSTPVWIDHRVMVTPFNAEKTLTKAAT